jgi:polysaccharide export outer membrane protein
MYSKKSNLSVFLLLSIIILSSCAGSKKVAYFQKYSSTADSLKEQTAAPELYDARIKPKDILSITVVTSEPEASKNYNLIVPQLFDPSSISGTSMLYSTPSLQTYLVDIDGIIELPVIGKLKVAGITRKELEKMLQEKLNFAFNKEIPIITIRIVNYSVNVLGEVMRPGKYLTVNDRMTIFEGLAMAGDMTIYGRRNNVKVLRENADGTKNYITVNLNDKNVINSPAYYLEQNDVVYVEPNKAKSGSSNIGAEETLSISGISILISFTSLMFNILKK